MKYSLNIHRELIGLLSTIDNTGIVEAKLLELDDKSVQKLGRVLSSRHVTRENQELFFKTVMIKKEHKDLFVKGQSSMVKDGNSYRMSSKSCTRLRFKGELQTLVRGSDGHDSACIVEIGSIDFNIDDAIPVTDDDVVIFSNDKATIYPNGTYRATVIKDE